MMTINRVVVAVLVAAALSACSSDDEMTGLRNTLEEIKQRPRGAIQPPPEFKSQPTYTYTAHKLRSPFLPPSDEAILPDTETKAVAPDLTRPREYLEQFNIEALRMVGTIARSNGPLVALIRDGSGSTQQVRVGNFMGKNFGRVIAVEDTRVSVVEIVPDGHDGWVERPRTIRLEGE